jgi:LAGLIDADG DNA endonuclease family
MKPIFWTTNNLRLINKKNFIFNNSLSNLYGLNLNIKRYYVIDPKNENNKVELSLIQKEVIVGSLLGDLSAQRNSPTSNTRLHIKQTLEHKEYVNHLYEIFKNLCKTPPKILSYYDKRPNRDKFYSSIKFNTLSLPCLNYYREIFYNIEGIKVIPLNIGELLTPRGLAYWIQDDGGKSYNNLYLFTNSYTKEEVELLIKTLKTNFDIDSSIQIVRTNQYKIYIKTSSMEKLKTLVYPYILPFFY